MVQLVLTGKFSLVNQAKVWLEISRRCKEKCPENCYKSTMGEIIVIVIIVPLCTAYDKQVLLCTKYEVLRVSTGMHNFSGEFAVEVLSSASCSNRDKLFFWLSAKARFVQRWLANFNHKAISPPPGKRLCTVLIGESLSVMKTPFTFPFTVSPSFHIPLKACF